MSIDTILFDMDGTLIDTNELIYESFNYTLKKFGYDFTKEEIMDFNGPPLIESFKKVNEKNLKEMVDVYREHNHLYHDKYVEVFPNVIETLDVLQDKGIKLGVVSTKMRQGVELGLSSTNIRDYFGSIITFDDVHYAKPHPEPVLKGMSELNSEPEGTLMVGDNYQDIESGKNAGVKTAAVAWSAKGAEFLRQFNPTYILEDMKDILKIIEV